MERCWITQGRLALCLTIGLTLGHPSDALAEKAEQAEPKVAEVRVTGEGEVHISGDGEVHVFTIDKDGKAIAVEGDDAKAPDWIKKLWSGQPEGARVKVLGSVTTVGPDGQAMILSIDDDAKNKATELPAEVLQRIAEAQEQARKQLLEAERQMATAQLGMLEARNQVKLKAEEIDKLRTQLQEASKTLQKLSKKSAKVVEGVPLNVEYQAAVSNLEEAIKVLNEKASEPSDRPSSYRRFFYTLAKDGLQSGQLPEEVRVQIAEAMKHRDLHWYARTDEQADTVSSKLDQILERLDKLESEVAELHKE